MINTKWLKVKIDYTIRNKIVLQKIIVIKTKDRVGNKERKIFLKKLLTANHMNVLSKKSLRLLGIKPKV